MDDPNFFEQFMTNHEPDPSQFVFEDNSNDFTVGTNATIESIDKNCYPINAIGSTVYTAPTSSQHILSFGGMDVPQGFSWDHSASTSAKSSKRSIATNIRAPPKDARDHIMAERKRREKLSQRLIALSAIVPGLKKTDKASILENATNYVKQLQERVKKLERQNQNKTIESIVLVRKSRLTVDDIVSTTSSLSKKNLDDGRLFNKTQLPEIEVKIGDKMVLVRIQCERHKGIFINVLEMMENLHLEVVNTSIIPFDCSLDMTIVAKMEEDYCMEAKDLVENLNSTVSQFH